MKIHLRQIPAQGLHLEGDEECPLSTLEPEELQSTGPLHYKVDAGISEGALWVTGSLVQPVKLRCVRCLESFPFEIEVKDFTVHTELSGPEEIDLSPFMREDVLLNLPPHPHCDREGGRICRAPVTHRAEESEAGPKPPTDWSALDELKIRES